MAPRGGAAGHRGWARPIAGAALLVVVLLLPGAAGASTTSRLGPASVTPSEHPLFVSLASLSSTTTSGSGISGASPPESRNLSIGTSAWTSPAAQQTTPEGPFTSIAYDAATGVFVAFGGDPGADGGTLGFSNQTWTFAGGHWTTQCSGDDTSQGCSSTPPARGGALLAYDPQTQSVILTGGFGTTGKTNTSTHPFDDEWSDADGQWFNLTSQSAPPLGLWDGALAYDPSSGVLLGITDVGGTWSYSDGNWTKLASVQSPPARSHPALFYDSLRRSMILYGGVAPGGRTLNDTWEYNALGWTKLVLGGVAPTTRGTAAQLHTLPIPLASAFDPVRGVGVLVDPSGNGGNSTWLFEGDSWVNATGSLGGPLPTGNGVGLAYDTADGYGLLLVDQAAPLDPQTFYLSDPFHIATARMNPVLDVNQTSTWSPSLSAGLPPYDTQMVLGEAHCTINGVSTPDPVTTCPGGSAGTENVSLVFADSAGRTATVNYTVAIHADPSLALGGVHPDPTSVGIPVEFGATPSLGTPPYSTLAWSFDDGDSLKAATPSHAFTTAGTYAITVSTTDSVGYPATVHFDLRVNPGPAAALAVNLSATDARLPLQFDATVVGGTGTDSCAWLFGDGTSSDACTPVHTYPVRGQYTARFWTNDSVGASGEGNLTVDIAAGVAGQLGFVAPAYAGQPVGLSVDPSGGIAPYTVAWSFGDGGTAQGASVEHSYGSSGTYAAVATVMDSVGGRATIQTNLTVAVDGGSLPGGPGGSSTFPSPGGSIRAPLQVIAQHAGTQGPGFLVLALVAAALATGSIAMDRARRGPDGALRAGWFTRGARQLRRALSPRP